MKPNALLIAILATSFSVYAQPQLLSDEMLPFGSEFHLHELYNLYEVDTNIQGADVTWDFSAFLDGGSYYDVFIMDPAATAHGSDFPDANYCYKEMPGSSYRYFKLETDNMMRVGSFTTASGLNTYTDPQIEYVFPLQLGAVSLDTWDNTLSGFGGGVYNIWCLGYGTLILPDITINDALMTRVEISEGGLYDFPVYFWYSSDNGAILCEYIEGDGFWVGSSGYYLYSMTEGTTEVQSDIISALRYNNPVENIFNMTFESTLENNLQYQVFNTIGSLVFTGSISASENQLSIDMGKCASGIYHLVLSDENSGEVLKEIKLMKE